MLRLHPYKYHRPRELGAALELLKANAGDALPVAGGTDLVPNMKHGLFTPGHVVSLTAIEELYGIEEQNGELAIGACESLDAVSRHPLVLRRYPALATAAGIIAHPMIRTRGTIGGNLCLDTRCTYYNQTYFWRKALGFCLKKDGTVCHVVPGGTRCVAAHSADTPPVLMTLDAQVEVASADGARTVPLSDFFGADGIWNTAREPHEIVTRVRIPKPAPGLRTSYQKLRERKSVDFPILSLALAVELDDAAEVVRRMALVVSALGARPRTIARLDELAVGERITDEVIEAVAMQAHKQCHPLDNLIVDPEWRRAMVPVHVRRAFREVLSGGRAAA